MQFNPLVSIIIPLYNREHIVTETVESCLVQTYRNIEIIIVDDCSTDNSVNVVKQLMLKDPRIILLQNKKNSNPAFSRNEGIKASKGELITFLDSDDLILKEKLEKCVRAYESNPVDCINSPVISTYHNKEDNISTIVPGADIIQDYLTRKIVWKVIGPVWTRKAVDRVGWFNVDKDLFGTEDFEFHVRAIIKGVSVHYLTEPLSVQVNVDPAIDKAKIRQSDKFEKMARKKIFSRVLVLKTIMRSELPAHKKRLYAKLILYYVISLMKRSFRRLSLSGFARLTWFLLQNSFRRRESEQLPLNVKIG